MQLQPSQIQPLRLAVAIAMVTLLGGCVFYDTNAVKLSVAPADSGVPSDMDAGLDGDRIDVGGDADIPTDTGPICEPDSDTRFCERLVLNCGDVTAVDNCGVMRTANCGACSPPATCGGGGTPNVCACAAQSDVDFCALNAECGPVTGIDACGQMRTVDCGTCTAPETCGGSGMSGVCGCAVESDIVFCSRQNACGILTADDNCQLPRSANCGSCGAGETCSNNVCVCEPEADPAFCARLNACQLLTAVDNCNTARTVECGACGGGEACTNNVCACTSESDTVFCARQGIGCGGFTGVDNCAMARTVPSCGVCLANENCNAGVCDAAFPPAGIEVWLRSADGVSVNAQDRLLQWADRLSGELWTPVAVNARPTLFNNGPGGLPLVRFYGGARLARSGPPLSSMQFTAIVVSSRAAGTSEGAILGVHGTSSAPDNELAYGATDTTMRFSSASGLSFSATVLPTGSMQVLTFRADGTNFEFYQGAVMTASTPHAPTSNFQFDAIGTFRYADGLEGDVQEVMMWPRALSEAERTAVLGYLKSRYGL